MSGGIGAKGKADAGKHPAAIKGAPTGARGAGTRTSRTIALEKTNVAAGIRETDRDPVQGIPAGHDGHGARYKDSADEAYQENPTESTPDNKKRPVR